MFFKCSALHCTYVANVPRKTFFLTTTSLLSFIMYFLMAISSECNQMPRKTRFQNELLCAKWDVNSVQCLYWQKITKWWHHNAPVEGLIPEQKLQHSATTKSCSAMLDWHWKANTECDWPSVPTIAVLSNHSIIHVNNHWCRIGRRLQIHQWLNQH